MSQQEHLFKISKSLLKPVDASKLRERRPLATLYAKTETPVRTGEAAALEIVKKMKKEKAVKIARAYSCYRLRTLLNRRIAARKVRKSDILICR